MSTSWIVAAVLVIVVGFFAYQWFNVASAKKMKTRMPLPSPVPLSSPSPASSSSPSQGQGQHLGDAAAPPPRAEEYPQVAGQSEGDLRQKEPNQRPSPPTNQQAVTADGKGPADFGENLRRPEQSFEPASAIPTMKVSDLPAGQGFNPEMAQTDGPVMGKGVFAFDGMEPTGFASF